MENGKVAMNGKSVLVTGDKGYIGTVLCERLSALGATIYGIDTGYYADNLIAPTFEPVSYTHLTLPTIYSV